ncbi:transposase [Massilibacteroides sp.]|uniref:transposase n=1 Tax=Massilibacteroides sp. TaxID=2034766 RepID=UPI0026135656|nr:transposase [Massilibacteroides sp.]MDD4514236.1 transposase [Massilibacteroides sp.]
MAQSLSKLYIHVIFHVKDNTCLIKSEIEAELYAYIGAIIKQSGSIPILLNGTENHIHILCVMSKNIALSTLVEDIKRNSSRWIKAKDRYYENFAWQGGYAGYSVSQSKVKVVKEYINLQKEHHKKYSFKDEYLRFLSEYNIDFNEQYLWN